MTRNRRKLIILADPVSLARPRRCGNRTFMDPRVEAARGRIAMHLRAVCKGAPDEEGRWRFSGEFRCETHRRRDLDRLVNLVLDAATGVLYGDDSQVDEFGKVVKRLGFAKGEGRTELLFERIA